MLDQAFLHEDVRLIAGKYHVWVHSDWIECDYFLEKPKEQREHIEQYYCEMCERHIQRVQEIMNEK